MTRRILITGGCGFIGTNAARRFLDKGYEVDLIDNFSRPGSEANKEFLEQTYPNAPLTITRLDIVEDTEQLRGVFAKQTYDAVIHAAAQVAVTTSVADPMFDFKVNVVGTLNVLEAARASEQKPVFIYTSTNKVYGGLEELSVAEGDTRYTFTDLPEGVHENINLDFHSPYGCSKGSADQYVRDYARIYDLPTVVFRQSCIYGPHQFGMVDQGWVAFLTMSVLQGKPITIYGDGKQVRDVLFVDDLIDAFEAAIESKEASAAQIFNMGGGAENTLSLLEFVTFLKGKLEQDIPVQFANWRPGDQRIYVSDVRKAGERLSWKPKTSFEQGFDTMLAWMHEHQDLLKKYS